MGSYEVESLGKWMIDGYLVRNFTGSKVSIQPIFIDRLNCIKSEAHWKQSDKLRSNHMQIIMFNPKKLFPFD